MFTAVAGIDSQIDEKEMQGLAKELSEAMLYKEPLAKEVFASVASDFGTVMSAYAADPRDVLKGLSDVADLLDRKGTAEQAKGFKGSVLVLGRNIAESSGGGLLHKKKTSEAEEKALMASFAALRFSA
jgi:hypothetical protein